MFYYILGVLVVLIVVRKAYHLYLSRQWNCEPLYLDKTFFLTYLRQMHRDQGSGFILERQYERLQAINKSTVGHKIFSALVIETSNNENIKAPLSTQFNDFGIGPRQVVFRPLLGHGIFASENQRWKISREMLRPQFAREQISHIHMLEPHFQNFASVISKQTGPFDLQELFHKLTFDAATDFLFGESTGTLTTNFNNQEFSQAFNNIQDIITQKMLLGLMRWTYNPPSYQKSLDTIHKSVRYYVDKGLNLTEKELATKKGYVFLYELVKQTRDPVILQDELLSIMLAGRNTTSALLSFLFYELSRNNDVWEKLKLEIYECFGQGDTINFDEITFESMKRCKYLKNCINETLRMYPPVSRNMRVAKKNTTLPRGGGSDENGPIFVPKGTHVIFLIYSLHRSEVFGEDPDSFNPDRWDYIKPGSSFLPFGTGPRICLGQQFALTEASYIVIRTLQTFPYISQTQGPYPPRKITNATMRLHGGLPVSLAETREKIIGANYDISKESF